MQFLADQSPLPRNVAKEDLAIEVGLAGNIVGGVASKKRSNLPLLRLFGEWASLKREGDYGDGRQRPFQPLAAACGSNQLGFVPSLDCVCETYSLISLGARCVSPNKKKKEEE